MLANALATLLVSVVFPQDPQPDQTLLQRMTALRSAGMDRELLPLIDEFQRECLGSSNPETRVNGLKMHLWRAAARQRLGEHAEALKALDAGESAVGSHDLDLPTERFLRTEIALSRASSQLALGRLDEALVAAEHAVDSSAGSGNHAFALNWLARIQVERGEPAAAVDSYRRALELIPDGSPNEVWVMSNLAECMINLGLLDEALAGLDQAANGLTDEAPKGQSIRLARLRAQVLLSQGRTHESLEAWRNVVEQIEANPGSLAEELATAQGEVAACLRATGNLADAVALARESVRTLEEAESEDKLAIAAVVGAYGNALRDLGDQTADRGLYDEARAAYERSLALRDQLGSPSARWDRIRLGVLLADHYPDEWGRAQSLLSDAIESVEAQRSRTQTLDSTLQAKHFEQLRGDWARWDPYERLAELLVKTGDLDSAVGALERGRARAALDLMERGEFDLVENARRIAEDDEHLASRLETADRRVEAARESLRPNRGSPTLKTQANARTAYETALRLQREISAEAQPVARTSSMVEVRKILDPGELMLTYLVTDHRAQLFVVPPPGEATRSFEVLDGDGEPVGAPALSARIEAFRAAMLSDGRNALARGARPGDRLPESKTPDWVSRSHALFRTLVPSGAWDLVRSASTVYVVPHASLHLLPFECLVVKAAADTNKATFWLDAGPPIAYGPSGSMLAWSDRRRAEQRSLSTERSGDVVIVANPKFSAASELAPLPGAEREAAAIAAALPKSTNCVRLIGAAATEKALFAAAPGARILHLATHQIPVQGSTWDAGRIVLASPDGGEEAGLEVDDLLTDWGNRLRGCELVTISSCRSRLGMSRNDEGVFGFPWGFQFAGCPTVLASSWPVDDDATASLMAGFYRRLIDTPDETRLQSLTAARKELRERIPHPFFWAPFVWIGCPD